MKTLKHALRAVRKLISNPKTLTALSCAGVGSTALISHLNTKKMMESDETSPLKRTCYMIPTVISGVITMAIIAINHTTNQKTILSLLTCAAMTKHKYQEFEQKAIDILGQDQVDEIRRQVALDHEAGISTPISPYIYMETDWGKMVTDRADDGDVLFHDPLIESEYGGIWFRTSKESVRLAWIQLLEKFANDYDASILYFYKCLGMELDESYKYLGFAYNDNTDWPKMRLIEAHINNDPENEVYFIIDYITDPELYACGDTRILSDASYLTFK